MDYLEGYALLKEMVVFRKSDIKKFSNSPGNFIKKYLNKKIYRLDRGIYSVTDAPLVIANYYYVPAYITSVSALSYHGLITQLPHTVICFTTKKRKTLKSIVNVEYHNTKYFYGFEVINYLDYKIKMATAEKAFLDSFNNMPMEYFIEASKYLDVIKLKELVIKSNDKSMIKRIGFILDYFNKPSNDLLKYISDTSYIKLDPLGFNKGKKNKKWHIINNYGDLND